MSNRILVDKSDSQRVRYDYEGNHKLEQFSSRCRRYQHNQCSGKVSKSRNESGQCPCYCHNEGDV